MSPYYLDSTIAIPSGPLYTTAKHAIMGVFQTTHQNSAGINCNIICPWFTETGERSGEAKKRIWRAADLPLSPHFWLGIIAPLTRVAIFGLPLCSVSDVIAAVVKSSCDETFHGNTVFVDATQVFFPLPLPSSNPASSSPPLVH